MNCRHCASDAFIPFADLGSAPPSNSYLTEAALRGAERWYPLRVVTCTKCWLVQTEDFADRGEFFSDDYAYFSSFSDSWLSHASSYVDAMVDRFGLTSRSHVVEVASNDGYLLQYVKAAGIPCLGIEPTHSTAVAARDRGIEVREEFFGVEYARKLVEEGLQADLTAANNVLAHVPDINDFVAGFALLLKSDGVSTFEFPHLMHLVEQNQFDTIYHEHYSYLSLSVVAHIFAKNGLTVFDVQEISTHGGSLRVFAQRTDAGQRPVAPAVTELLEREAAAGVQTAAYYSGLQPAAERVADDLLIFLIEARAAGKAVMGYGAAAKGNTLINFAGVRPSLLPGVVDRNPAKQNKYLPGSRIPVASEDELRRVRPDYVLILPWNLKTEVMQQLAYIREWGGQFVTAVPGLQIA